MTYGAYKNARDAAWQCLIDYNVKSLPVNIFEILKSAGIKFAKNSNANLVRPNESGISLLIDEQWYIIYDDTDTPQRCRFTLAHELGHILLGHELKEGRYARTFNLTKPAIETQSDIFASRLLAPACVLWGLDLHTPKEIALACDISLQAAKIRAERMRVLYKRNKFLTNPLERTVYKNFEEFIIENKK